MKDGTEKMKEDFKGKGKGLLKKAHTRGKNKKNKTCVIDPIERTSIGRGLV